MLNTLDWAPLLLTASLLPLLLSVSPSTLAMFTKVITCLCLLAAAMSASAFVAPAAPVAVRSQSAMSMTAQQQSAPKAFAAASAALLSAAPAFATEGTSEVSYLHI
jgi:hypothetical protein